MYINTQNIVFDVRIVVRSLERDWFAVNTLKHVQQRGKRTMETAKEQ
jgi:hypothetical protein